MTIAPADWACACSGQCCCDRNLELGQQHIAVGDRPRARAALSSVSRPLAPGATTMVFSAVGIYHDDRRTAGPGLATVPFSPTPLASKWARNCSAAGSSPDRADELHLRACPRRGHGLIAALAAG